MRKLDKSKRLRKKKTRKHRKSNYATRARIDSENRRAQDDKAIGDRFRNTIRKHTKQVR